MRMLRTSAITLLPFGSVIVSHFLTKKYTFLTTRKTLEIYREIYDPWNRNQYVEVTRPWSVQKKLVVWGNRSRWDVAVFDKYKLHMPLFEDNINKPNSKTRIVNINHETVCPHMRTRWPKGLCCSIELYYTNNWYRKKYSLCS